MIYSKTEGGIMMKHIALLFLGIIFMSMGLTNLKGNISTIHWYNRRKVSETDAPKYGKAMGLGTFIIGASIGLTAVLQMIFDLEIIFYLMIVGLIIGVSIMLYAQFKYNKGIF